VARTFGQPPTKRRLVRFIAPLLTLTIMWLAAPMAHAWTPPPTDDAARLAAYLPIARAAWTGSPCAGREVVHLQADAVLRAEAPGITGSAGSVLDGMAAPTICEVWLAGDLDPLTFCTVLVHEIGHLAGREHNAVAGDVLNGDGNLGWEPCRAAVTPPPVLVAQEVRAELPAPQASWRVGCGPARGGARRCVARRGTLVRRYRVRAAQQGLAVVRVR
jgi:hypothetical protein